MDRFEKTKLLGLDFDDTVTSNSMSLYVGLYKDSLTKAGVDIPEAELRDTVQPVWGSTAEDVIRYVIMETSTEKGIQEPPEEEIATAVKTYEQTLRSGIFADRANLVLGVRDVLQKVKNRGIQIGLATGNAPEVLEEILLKNDIEPDFFVDRVSAYHIRKSDRMKPHPYSLNRLKRAAEAVRKSGILNQEIVYVGDSGNDVRMAQAMPGVEPVVVLTGNLTRQEALGLGVSKLSILKDVCQIEEVLERRESS